jgi:hypothetical protein
LIERANGLGEQRSMIKRIVFAAAFVFIVQSVSMTQVQAGSSPRAPGRTDEVLAASRHHVEKGEGCLTVGDVECARREFDSAIDEFLESGVDLRTDERLLAGWRETIEKVNRLEKSTSTASGKQFWRSQDFEGHPPDERVAETIAESNGPLTSAVFQARFSELRKRFQEKYEREITLTGADHAEHRRLYGSGSAYDIRVRDLTREQVKFIIATGGALGLRIKDFSTWVNVAAHNARTLMLGRPLDTLATGIHLHIDRMVAPKQTLNAVPVVKTSPRQPRRTKSR